MAICQQPGRLDDPETKRKCLEILTQINRLILDETERIRILARKADDWCISGVPFVIVPALVSICESIAALIADGRLFANDHPISSLAIAFQALFDGQAYFGSGVQVAEREQLARSAGKVRAREVG